MPCPESDAALGPCPNCRARKFSFNETRTIGPYDGQLRTAVLKIKHAYHEPLAADLGRQLALQIRQRPFADSPELVVPVPMFWLQRLWRGTNAAQIVALALAHELAIPIATDLLICRRWLRKQSTLRTDERRRNVRRAFRASWRFNIDGARILLVDDVMTTGATSQEAARVLRKAGASAVFVAAVARSTHAP
jgi:ComF family protein